jgi:NADPH:quinone reductase-like Zn-dependent oxidoreductase
MPSLGIEGSGIIMDVGEGLEKSLIGKKVCY